MAEQQSSALGLTRTEANHLRRLVEDHTGVRLEPDHDGLLMARLSSYTRQRPELPCSELLLRARCEPEGEVARELAEALLNGETSFFRDPLLFEELREWVLPELLRSGDRVEIWCAACSTGQEPYSLAMLIADEFPQLLEPGRLRIIASDVSRHHLAIANEAVYSRLELNRGLPAPMFLRWFEQLPHLDVGRERWRLHRRVRELVELRQLNLLAGWRLLPPMQLILLRNVMLYWSAAAREQVLARVPEQLAARGYFVVGGAEVLAPGSPFRAVQPARWRFYQRLDAPSSTRL